MSNENHETIADIVAEMRECADRMEKRGLFDLRGCGTEYLRALADLLEAAATREREAGAALAISSTALMFAEAYGGMLLNAGS